MTSKELMKIIFTIEDDLLKKMEERFATKVDIEEINKKFDIHNTHFDKMFGLMLDIQEETKANTAWLLRHDENIEDLDQNVSLLKTKLNM